MAELKILLYTRKPHLVCLCETWAIGDKLPNFINYKAFWKNRVGNRGGGIAILSRLDLVVIPKPLNIITSDLEFQAVAVKTDACCFDLLNLYNPNRATSKSILSHYIDQLGPRKIIVGDLNAHHHMWSRRGTPNNTVGVALSMILDESNDLCLATPPELTTYIDGRTGQESTLDLCVLSSDLIPDCEVKTLGCVGSDHYPISLSLNIKPFLQPIKLRPKWKLDNIDWNQWRNGLPDLQWNDDLTLDESNDRLVRCLKQSTYRIHKTNSNYKPHYPKPWWNKECSKLVALRRRAKNKVRRNATAQTIAELRRAENAVKCEIQKAKQFSIQSFASTINSFTPLSSTWRKINCIRNRFSASNVVLEEYDSIITDPQQKNLIFSRYFHNIFNRENPSNERNTEYYFDIQRSIISDTEYSYNIPFSMHELQNALNKMRDTSPGHDDVHNLFLKNANHNIKCYMLKLFNKSWIAEELPRSWKNSIVLPICKPGKPPEDKKSYRPISLLSSISKLMERLVVCRLNWLVEDKKLLSPTQSGFRARRSTNDQLTLLDSEIKRALSSNMTCITVFIDLAGAFDKVWHMGLLKKLQLAGIEGRMLGWIRSYLMDRKFNTYFEGEESNVRNITSGVPQGAVLSPLLFNMMMRDIPKLAGINYSEFADDIALYITGSNLSELSQKMQRAISELIEWTNCWGLEINLGKTKAMFFNRSNTQPDNIEIQSDVIEYVPTYRFLGLTLDSPRLSYKGHINNLKSASTRVISVLKFLSHSKWGSDRKTLEVMYKTLIRSKLDYACHLYGCATQLDLKALDTIQNQCLRIIIGTHQTSPILSMEAESNIPPLCLRRKYMSLKYYYKIRYLLGNAEVSKVLYQNNGRSFMDRILNTLNEWDLPTPRQSRAICAGIPPWVSMGCCIRTDFGQLQEVKNLPPYIISQIFSNMIHEKYNGFIQIFTDGSKFSHQTSSAIVIPCIHEASYTLPGESSVFTAELYAIKQALIHLRSNCNIQSQKYVILTDSISVLKMLKSSENKNHVFESRLILGLLHDLNDSGTVILQWIPGHQGIYGNTLADEAAKNLRNLQRNVSVDLTYVDTTSNLDRVFTMEWQKYWEQRVITTNTGKRLKEIKEKVTKWSWSYHKIRALETVMAKLRIGHICLKQHLFRFHLAPDPLCDCGEIESIEHFILHCSRYELQRNELYASVRRIDNDITLDLKTLLGGNSDLNEDQQHKIIKAMFLFLLKTKRLYTL